MATEYYWRMMTLRFTGHALDEMAAEDISIENVRAIITAGTVLREYPEDKPFPSRLMLGWVFGAPIHVVCANESTDMVVVITTYRPDPALWDDTFTRRIER